MVAFWHATRIALGRLWQAVLQSAPQVAGSSKGEVSLTYTEGGFCPWAKPIRSREAMAITPHSLISPPVPIVVSAHYSLTKLSFSYDLGVYGKFPIDFSPAWGERYQNGAIMIFFSWNPPSATTAHSHWLPVKYASRYFDRCGLLSFCRFSLFPRLIVSSFLCFLCSENFAPANVGSYYVVRVDRFFLLHEQCTLFC